jgi:hypothetical protein
MTPIEAILSIIDAGGWVLARDGKLVLETPTDPEVRIVDALRCHKPAILEILRYDWLVVESSLSPGHQMFWCPSREVRTALIQSGVSPGSIWTREELGAVVQTKPSRNELRAMIQSKRRFDGHFRQKRGLGPGE